MPRPADLAFSKKIEAFARGLDRALEEQYGARLAFVLVVAPLNQETTQVQYVSNVSRTAGQGLLRRLFRRWGQHLPDVPTHEAH